MKKGILISLIVGLILVLIIVVTIKINSPIGIIMKQGFKQLNRITLIDREKVKELETELKTIRFERDSILNIQEKILKENKSLYLTLDKQEQINLRLNNDLRIQRNRIEQLITIQLLSPSEQTKLFDNLTTDSKYPQSVLLDEYFAKISVDRLAEANYKIQREKELEEENAIQQELIENLELTNNSLKRINSNTENALVQCNSAFELTLEEKNQFRDLYLESSGKTRKGLFIAYSIIVVETIVLVWVLAGSASN